MDLVKLWYDYKNRLINSDELLVQLNKYDIIEIKKLIKDIKKIKKETSNEIDEIERNRLKNLDQALEGLKKIDKKDISADDLKLLENTIKNVEKEKLIVRDGGELYENILNALNNCYLVYDYLNKMNNEQLFDFITSYINVDTPIKIDDDTFADLVEIGIRKDNSELLWRLGFNYNDKENFNYNKIMSNFVSKKDVFYIRESLYAFKESINMNFFYDELIALDDKDFLISIFTPDIMDLLSNEDIELMITKGIDNNILTKEEIKKLKVFIKTFD